MSMMTSRERPGFRPGGNPYSLRNEARRRDLWRPTAVAITNLGGRYIVLVGRRPRFGARRNGDALKPDLPKGGIEWHQSPSTALRTELWQEARVHSSNIVSAHFLGHAFVRFGKYNGGRDGYRKGKLYLMYYVSLARKTSFGPGRSHGVERTLILSAFMFRQFFKNGKGGSKKYGLLADPELWARIQALR